jgi:hypothetical protein
MVPFGGNVRQLSSFLTSFFKVSKDGQLWAFLQSFISPLDVMSFRFSQFLYSYCIGFSDLIGPFGQPVFNQYRENDHTFANHKICQGLRKV